MTIQSSVSKIAYVGSGTTGPFYIPWLFYSDTDIVAQTTVTATGVTTTLVLSTDYSLTNTGTAVGNSLTLTSSLAATSTLTIYLDPPLLQLSDYVGGAAFPSATLEQDFDRDTQVSQRLKQQIINAIRAPDAEAAPGMTLPAAINRANKFVVFDGSGNVSTSVGSGTDTGLRSDLIAALSLLVGSNAVSYKQTAAELAASVTPVNLYYKPGHIFRYGATGDGVTDDTLAIQSAINYVQSTYVIGTSNSPANGTCRLFIPAGYYKITNTLTVKAKIAIEGEGQTEFSSGSRLLMVTANKSLFKLDSTLNSFSFSLEKLVLKNTIAGSGYLVDTSGVFLVNSQRYIDCTFANPQQQSLLLCGDDIMVDNCLFDVSGFSGQCIQLGTVANVASNITLNGNNFFNAPTRCVLVVNASGLVATSNKVTQSAGTTTATFIDAADAAPALAQRFTITGNTLQSVSRIFEGASVSDVTISGNTCSSMGQGVGEVYNAIKVAGASNNITIVGNSIRGEYGAKNFIKASGTTGLTIVGNTLTTTTTTGSALNIDTSTGIIAPNSISGFSVPIASDSYLAMGIIQTSLQTMTYSASITPDARAGRSHKVTVTNGTAFTLNAPLNPSAGQEITITIINASGGAIGVITWNALYKMSAWTNPANNQTRSITFRFDGANWFEISRTPSDVPV